MTRSMNGNTNGTGAVNGNCTAHPKAYPQVTYQETRIDPTSFCGILRRLYADKVLKTQLEQLRKQGSYEAFRLQWHPAYDVRRLKGAKARTDGIPPSLFWESDVGKWIEAACYFLSVNEASEHAEEFKAAIDELVAMIEAAQQPDGYLNVYFTVVDPTGRFMNVRDMHEMYNAGHLLEAALAHYHYTGSRRFLDVMIKNIDCFIEAFGPNGDQLQGYPGHPELELAVLRLYDVTKDPRHLAFGRYLLEERGVVHEGETFFVREARRRKDEIVPSFMTSVSDTSYQQAHLPLAEQEDILGHSVRAFYLLTGASDAGGPLLDAARRLWDDATNRKMYVTGGFGSDPAWEGFSRFPHYLPQSTNEGGCYTETCASIAAMMCAERMLNDKLDGKVRDTLELAFLNAVLGGGSLDGKAFAYDNKLATSGDEVATRKDWFEVCCCPPNLSRTLGILGGYTWAARVDTGAKGIALDVYLFVSATRTIDLGDGQTATARMSSNMPWTGKTELELSAPEGWTWDVRLPKPAYASNVVLSSPSTEETGFLRTGLHATSNVSLTFDLPVRILASHPVTGDTLTVTRGPIVFVAESADNEALDTRFPHFAGLGLSPSATFSQEKMNIEGVPVITLQSKAGDVLVLNEHDTKEAYREVSPNKPSRTWTALEEPLVLVPWFARANRGGAGRVRTSFRRAE